MSAEIVVVTGTGTGIGKTVVTAAIAVLARRRGRHVAVIKPGQTGVRGDDVGDAHVVQRLSGVEDVYELARYPDPISPAAAARLSHLPPLKMHAAAQTIAEIATVHDLVLIEGSGGLLVEYNDERETIADLASELSAPMMVVVRPNIGTLNHTALTLEAMEHRGLALAGLVIGSWPEHLDLASRTNLEDLERVADAPLSGAIRERSGRLGRPEFLAAADRGLAPGFGGHFEASDFRRRFEYRRTK